MPTDPAPPAPSEGLARYERLGELGRGGMAVVYRARDTRLHRDVALKVLREDQAGRDQLRARFVREAEIAARLTHPNLVAVHDVIADGPSIAIVMELVGGQSLGTLMTGGRLGLREQLVILEKAARGIHYAHLHGIVHRDVKPANILVDEAGEPKVTDFGLAHLADSDLRLTRAGAAIGTPYYMAPEQVRGEPDRISARSDVYAFGAILYEMLAGSTPFESATLEQTYRRILFEDPRRPGKDPDLETIALKALEKDPADRYATAEEFADDLRRHLSGEPVRARPRGPIPRLLRRVARNPVRSALVLVIPAVLALTAGWFWRRGAAMERYHAAYYAGMESWNRLAKLMGADQVETEAARELAGTAVERFRAALEADPARPDPWLMIGRCHLALGDSDEAERAWTAALRLRPSFSPARFERAKHRLETYGRMRLPSGVQVAPGRIRPGTSDPETEEQREWRHRGEEDLRAAFAELAAPERSHLQGLLAFGEGRYEAAVDLLGDYVAKNPWDSRAFLLLGAASFFRGHFTAADAQLTRALRLEPRPAWFKLRGDARLCGGNPGGAVDDYDAAIRADARLADAHCNRALALQSLGRLPDAERSATAALDLRPTWARALNVRGTIRVERRDLVRAREDFEAAILHHPLSIEALNNLGNLFLLQGDLEEAIERYGEALDLEPGNVEIRCNRGKALNLLGDLDGALRDFTEAVRLDPSDVEARYSRARCLQAKGDLREAAAELREALGRAPADWARRKEAERLLEEWSR